MKKDRFEMFSDGVMAIIITLMILEIKLPALSAGNFWVLDEDIAIYALSFIVVAITWLNHHNMFLRVGKVNTKIIWFNFLLLFFMSLIPLSTKSLEEFFFHKESHMLYGSVLAGVSLAYTLLQISVYRVVADVKSEDKGYINKVNWAATILYAASIPLSFVSVYISTAIFVMFPIIYFIPSKRLIEEA